MGGFALGGRFTTVEGLLNNVQEQLENNPFLGTVSTGGDATTQEANKRMADFNKKFTSLIEGREHFTLVLDDPTGNSYLQVIYWAIQFKVSFTLIIEKMSLNASRFHRRFPKNSIDPMSEFSTIIFLLKI